MHEVFERIDFSTVDRARVQAVAEERLRAHGFGEPGLATEVSALVERVLDVELIPGATLRAIPERVCWRELEFLLPLRPLTPARLREAFAEVPRGAEFVGNGGSLMALTAIVTVAGPLCVTPSPARYVNVVVPLKFGFGEKLKEPSALSCSTLFGASRTSSAVNGAPSGSESLPSTPGAATASGVSSSVV